MRIEDGASQMGLVERESSGIGHSLLRLYAPGRWKQARARLRLELS